MARETNLDPIDLLDVIFNLPGGHSAGVQRNDGFGEVSDRGLMLGDNFGVELAVAIARRFDFHLSEIAADRFRDNAVAELPLPRPSLAYLG